MRRLGIALIAVLVFCADAQGDWRIGRAQRVAKAIWAPPCAFVRVDVVEDLPLNGQAFVEQCRIEIQPMEWPALCTTIIHEYGHLAGYRDPVTGDIHSSEGFMRAFIRIWVFTIETARGVKIKAHGADPRCKDRGRAILGKPPMSYGWG